MFKCLLRKLKKNSKGVALIELALIMPILLVLLLGLIEFGWIYNGYITITGAAREGARVAAVGGNHSDAIDDHINWLSALQISTVSKTGGAAQGDDIVVKVNGNLTLIGAMPFLNETFPLSAEATMRRQYANEIDDNNNEESEENNNENNGNDD